MKRKQKTGQSFRPVLSFIVCYQAGLLFFLSLNRQQRSTRDAVVCARLDQRDTLGRAAGFAELIDT